MEGPAVIGLLARATSLTAALYVVVVFAAALAASARYTAGSNHSR